MKPEPSAPADELAVIAACLISDIAIEDTSAIITASDFQATKHQVLYGAILDLHHDGQRVDPYIVHRTLGRDDITLEELHRLILDPPAISNAARYALGVADAKVRRELIHAADEITNLANGATATQDAADAAERARLLLADIDMPAGRGAPDPDIDSFIRSVDTSYDWLIPGFLERRDRMLVTAAEGMGKSVLLAQIAVQTAAGIHPWTNRPITPRNVLLVDLENSPRLVTRRLDRLRRQASTLDPQRLRIHCRPAGLDLTTRTDRRWLIDRCQANAAELLVIGPAYRMSAGVSAKGDIGGEDQARTVTKALDDIRTRCGVTLLMETHAPHGPAGGRDLRPFGSSVWLRWPEFGVGFAVNPQQHNEFRLSHWRGPRDQRLWPKALQREAGRWPWTPILPAGERAHPDDPPPLNDHTLLATEEA